MSTSGREKEERIEIRLSASEKRDFIRAQKISGEKTFSAFITRALRTRAQEIIQDHERILGGSRDRKIFFDAVFSDIAPNSALVDAFEKYKAKDKEK